METISVPTGMRNSKNDAKALDDKLTGSLLAQSKHTHVAVTVDEMLATPSSHGIAQGSWASSR